jgi:hypothetical protein
MPLISEEVLLRVRTAWQGDEIQRGLSRLQQQLASLGSTVKASFSLLLPGASIGVVAGLTAAIRQAIQLSAQFEKMRTGIAAILGSYGDVVDAQGRVLKGAERFNQLLQISQRLMTQIRQEADRTILETRELMEYVQTGLGYGLARGLTAEQMIPLISRMAVAGRVMGLPQGYPIISEIRALLTGEHLEQSQIARAVGITARDIQRLRGEQLIQYFNERLSGFVAASDAFAQSFEARWSTFVSKIQEILIEVGNTLLPVLSEFAQRATVALEQWRQSGGVARLQEVVRAILSAVASIGNWIGQLVSWVQQHPTLSSIIGWAGGGALIGGRVAGLPGAGIGALTGLGVMAIGEIREAWRYARGEDEYRERFEQLLGKATGISSGRGTRAPAPTPAAPPLPVFRVRPIPPPGTDAASRQRERLERRVRVELADLAVARAESALNAALRDAAEWGYAPEAVSRAKQALEQWAQARLARAKAAVHGEDARIASALMEQARLDIAERKQQVIDQLERGRRSALEEEKREAYQILERRWETQAQIEQERQRRYGEQARLFFGGIAGLAKGISERGLRFFGAIETATQLEYRRRVQGARIAQELAAEGTPWLPFGVPPVFGGAIRTAMRVMPFGELVVAAGDAMAQALEDWRERQRRFWTGIREFIVDSLHDAFITAGMRLADSLGSWREAFANLFRTIKEMFIRAILEVLYERVIRAAVEAFADWLTQRLGGGGRGKTGAAIGSSVGAAIGSAAGPVGAAIGGIIGGLIGGIFQHGGTALPRRMYIVGERGPELFVPGTVGAVLSSKALENALNRLGERRSAASVNVYVNHTTEADLARRIGREVVRSLRGAW